MAAAASTHEAGTVLADRYALAGVLGSGASARVYLATDVRRQCPVAVKILHESLASDGRFVAQLRREASLAASLNHENIVRIIDSGTTGDPPVPFVVTDHMAGGSLAAILDAGWTLDAAQAADVGRQVADALAHAHDTDLVHRDVKPSNLLFDLGGRVALADFGIARAVAEASSTEPADGAMGTTRYASPESVMGRSAEPRSDVYSLGLVLLESLTGSVPLLGDTAVATMGRRVGEDVEVPAALGLLGEALESATAREPADRVDVAELSAMLAAAASDLDPPGELPLQPVQVGGEDTAELRVDRSGGAVRILGIAPLGSAQHGAVGTVASGAAGTADRGAAGQPGTIDLTDGTDTDGTDTDGGGTGTEGVGAGPAVGDRDDYGRDAITVAQEYHALGSSVPGGHGVVEPLTLEETRVVPGRSGAGPPGTHSAAGADREAGAGAPEAASPKRRWRWVLVLVALLVSSGFAAWWFLVRVPTHEVPDWVGADIDSATEAARDAGWEVGPLQRTRRDGTSAGQVLDQDPGAGTVLAEGSAVSFTVSDGPTLTLLPEVTGIAEAEARSLLEEAGLLPGARTEAFDEAVPAGAVVSAAVVADGDRADQADPSGQVPKGTAVDYVVSLGPAPRPVPERIVGVPVADARAALQAVQLSSSVTEEYSSDVGEGLVIRASAGSGAELPRDSVVELVVSAGPEPVVVPDVTGRTGSEAAAALEAAGFTVSGIEGSPSGTVLATDPTAGESRTPGSSVRVFTRSG